MPLKLATWNINSVRLRINLVERFLEEYQPDVLCLQETKCPNDAFPSKAFRKAGYEHIAFHGQKGYHGVATVSRIPFRDEERRDFCEKGDTRHLAVTLDIEGGDGVRVHNFYVPAGGDEPNREVNEKFAHKLDFLTEMESWYKSHKAKKNARMILVGDLNVAPLEHDVWSHKQLLKVVSHTPIEVESLQRFMDAHGWSDIGREHVKAPERYYSWWSYRSKDWKVNDRGRRLDHMWASPELARQATGHSIHEYARDWEKPSDHVPLVTEFAL